MYNIDFTNYTLEDLAKLKKSEPKAFKKVSKFISLDGAAKPVFKLLVEQISAQNPEMGKIAESQLNELQETDTIQEVNPLMQSILQPTLFSFLKSWNAYNPSEVIQKLKQPVLVINGDADMQVLVNDAKLLHDAKPESELVIVQRMNHVLKLVNNPQENQSSYFEPNFPIPNQLVEVIVTFIKKYS